MNRIQITGKIPLCGEIAVQGSKNAALPLMAASVLHEGRTVLHNCPRILDVESMAEILRELGCMVVWEERHTLLIDAKSLTGTRVSERLAASLRASVILLGSLLGRCGEAQLPCPGGCSIGSRPIDLHLKAMNQMGAMWENGSGGIRFFTEGLRGSEITLTFPSVGATENVILAAVRAQGTTRIRGAAREPEIQELCRFLKEKGARITEEGGEELLITGVEELKDTEHTLIPDRIVAGTYLCAAAGSRGRITLNEVIPKNLGSLLEVLEQAGAKIQRKAGGVTLDGKTAVLPVSRVETAPYPGFPTDMQSQLMAFLCGGQGVSRITENLFEARFLIAEELKKMGAEVVIQERTAWILGGNQLKGTCVTARDLRGGAALVIAGLMAEGETVINGCQYIDRGYEDICRDLAMLGADIRRI